MRVIGNLRAGRVEDSRVEFKREWPSEPADVARRVAGHANASHSDPILWLVGIDDKTKAIVGCNDVEIGAWWAGPRACFQPPAPDLTEVALDLAAGQVIALAFTTDRPPYVVKNPDYGRTKTSIASEVPWRELSGIRTARRDELLVMLADEVNVPTLEVGRARVIAPAPRPEPLPNVETLNVWTVTIEMYVEHVETSIVVPWHRCELGLVAEDVGPTIHNATNLALEPAVDSMRLGGRGAVAATIIRGVHQTIIEGPGRCVLSGRLPPPTSYDLARSLHSVRLEARLGLAGSRASASVEVVLEQSVSTENIWWEMKDPLWPDR
jgi:hypothetical protein